MSERAPENLEAIKVSGVDLDRSTLDEALKGLDRGIRMKRIGEAGLQRDFSMHMVMDKRSGRILEATMQATDTLEATHPDRTVVTVEGQFTQLAGKDGKAIEESLSFQNITIANEEGLKPIARDHLKKLLESWREKHNAYIIQS